VNNTIQGQPCPPVICRRDPYFPLEWWNGHRWQRGASLPAEIMDRLPQSERERVERHVWGGI
jgi:hypothetical protein